MPAGQLSIILRTGSDTLPTPLNLKDGRCEWTKYVSSMAPLFQLHYIISMDVLLHWTKEDLHGDMTVSF